tara:strand:- start:6325 stop:6906 length:582 start_codon:yes stop_codon:yes gene_type:complete
MDNSTKIIAEITDILNYLGDDHRYKYGVIWTMKHFKRKYGLRKPRVDVDMLRHFLNYFPSLDIHRSWDVFENSDYEYEKKLYDNNMSKLVSENTRYYRLITLCVLLNMFFDYIVNNNFIQNEIKSLDELRTYKYIDAVYERIIHFIDRCGEVISEAQSDTFSTKSDKITTIRCFEKMKNKFEKCKRLYEIDMK